VQKGYKSLRLTMGDTPGSTPRLKSPSYTHEWKPGENTSSFSRDIKEDFKGSTRGFYALKTPEELVSAGYYPLEGGVATELAQYGKVGHGAVGYRSEKAQVSIIFEEDTCDLCSNAPAKYILKPDGTHIMVCEDCYKRLKKVLPKSKKLGEVEREEVFYKLGKHYDVPVVKPPETFRTARKRLGR